MVEDRAESRAVISLLYIKQRARQKTETQREREQSGRWLAAALLPGRPVYGSKGVWKTGIR